MPRCSLLYSSYRVDTDAISFGQNNTRRTTFANLILDFPNLLWGQLRAAVPQSNRMPRISRTSNPFQVTKMVVQSVAIFVIDLMLTGWREAIKCPANQSVNSMWLGLPRRTTQIYEQITLFFGRGQPWLKNSPHYRTFGCPNSSDLPKARHFIQFFPSLNRTPFFGVAILVFDHVASFLGDAGGPCDSESCGLFYYNGERI